MTLLAATGVLTVPTFAAAGPPKTPTPVQLEEARQRFQHALDLADDGDFDASLLELRRAYDLAPSYKLLYNIGLVYQTLKEYARAYDAFDRYLREGGTEVPADRADDVHRRMDRLKLRIAYLSVGTTLPGAEVLVDDLSVGTTPLAEPLRVNSGQRKVTVRLGGHPTESRIVELAGGDVKSLLFDLRLPTAPPPPPPKSPLPWISWGITGALAAGATVTGILALQAASNYDQQAQQGPGQDLGPAWTKLHTLSLTTDVLIAAAVLGGGISTYFTIWPPKTKPNGKEAALVVLPGGIAGRF